MGITVDYHIRRMTNTDEDFYTLLGPFLARRTIVKEVGGPIWDDDGMSWFVALSPDEEVLGFAALRERMDKQKNLIIEFDNAYVLPKWREQGVYSELLDARLVMCQDGATLRAIVNNNAREKFLQRGFKVRRQRGKAFTEVEMIKE